jgi:PEP-CTERM motif
MRKVFATALAALAALGCTMPLFAAEEVTSRAAWSELAFTLEDLDPDDGVLASISGTFRERCEGSPQAEVLCEFSPDLDFQLPPGSSSSNIDYPLDIYYDRIDSILTDRFYFDLSPNTRLTISGLLSAESSAPAEDWMRWAPDLYLHGFANASARAAVRMGDGSVREVTSVDAERNETTFSLSLSSGAQSLSTFVSFDLDAITTTHQELTSVIPEPGSYALLLSGLGVIGLFARRKTRLRRRDSTRLGGSRCCPTASDGTWRSRHGRAARPWRHREMAGHLC